MLEGGNSNLPLSILLSGGRHHTLTSISLIPESFADRPGIQSVTTVFPRAGDWGRLLRDIMEMSPRAEFCPLRSKEKQCQGMLFCKQKEREKDQSYSFWQS